MFPNAILLTYESLWDDSLSALLAATLLWATFRLRNGKTAWALYGLLWGVALMTNAAFIIILPFLFAYLRRHDWRRHAIASSIVILCCVPWTVRNFRAFNAVVPLRSNAGIALWLGNNGEFGGRPQGWLHPIANPAEREKYIEMGELAYAHAKQQEALHYIAAHPLITMTSAGTRFIEWWTGGGWRIRSLRGALVIPFNALAAAGAFSGLWLLYRKRSPHLLPFAAFVLVFPLIYYFTLAIPRYRLPADPAILSLAAYACVRLANYKKGQLGPLTVT